MHGLGFNREQIESQSRAYVGRLERATSEPQKLSDIADGFGERGAYRGLVRYFDDEITRCGVQETLQNHLPSIVSGWVRHAFHGTIRLGYGIRFNVDSEVSAGLAYLASAGPDDRLATIGRSATPADRFVWPPAIDISKERFDDRYEEVIRADTFGVHTHTLAESNDRVAEEVLDIFNHTQGFFGLHMVTGTHAFDLCVGMIESEFEGLRNAGLAAAYLTIGAPMFVHNAKPKPLRMDFAHEVKVAFSCLDQAERLDSERYREAFDVYSRRFN